MFQLVDLGQGQSLIWAPSVISVYTLDQYWQFRAGSPSLVWGPILVNMFSGVSGHACRFFKSHYFAWDLGEIEGLPVASIPSIPFELVEISTTTLWMVPDVQSWGEWDSWKARLNIQSQINLGIRHNHHVHRIKKGEHTVPQYHKFVFMGWLGPGRSRGLH